MLLPFRRLSEIININASTLQRQDHMQIPKAKQSERSNYEPTSEIINTVKSSVQPQDHFSAKRNVLKNYTLNRKFVTDNEDRQDN